MSIVLNQYTLLAIGSLLGAALVFQFLKNQANGQVLAPQPWTIWQLCLFLVAMNVIGAIVGFVIRPYLSVLRESFGFARFLLEWYELLAIVLFVYVFRSGPSTVGLGREHLSIENTLIGMKWGFALLCVLMVLGMLAPKALAKVFNDQMTALGLGAHSGIDQMGISGALTEVLKITYGMVLVSLTEEIEYRGLLYKTLRVRMSRFFAALVSSICFLAPHGVLSLSVFAMGLVTAILLEKYGSLVPAILIHAIWDIGMRVAKWCLVVFQIEATLLFKMGFLITFLGAVGAWAALRIRAHGDGKGVSVHSMS
ncbi:MAG: CPBP family intramembrane metalloprotease [Nitrospira sp.]|nr:CPBP family intramembrane metalloprotease [Nitrospira sp.]